mgnify:FL=1
MAGCDMTRQRQVLAQAVRDADMLARLKPSTDYVASQVLAYAMYLASTGRACDLADMFYAAADAAVEMAQQRGEATVPLDVDALLGRAGR